jgi:signal transduction histidine kinase
MQESNILIEIEKNLPVVFGDRQRLLEVVQNLLDNAAKFMGAQPSPEIQIGVAGTENNMPVLYVRDNGVGIDPQFHERIFGLFNRLDPGVDGTGIGLALVRRIVEFHGGRVWVESEVGKGATFLFTLPLAENGEK